MYSSGVPAPSLWCAAVRRLCLLIHPLPKSPPPRPQERVRRAGGKVVWQNGMRVMGALSMTRAIGDHFLRRHGVIAEPELSGVRRSAGDEFLILATDGLWNFVSLEEAAAVARRALRRADAAALPRRAAAVVAPRALTKLALARGGSDNVSVVMVDLRPAVAAVAGQPAAAPAAAAPQKHQPQQPAAAGTASPFHAASMQLPQLNLPRIRTRQPPSLPFQLPAGAADGMMARSRSDMLPGWCGAAQPAAAAAAAVAAAAAAAAAESLADFNPSMLRAKSAPVRMHHHTVTTGGPSVPPAQPPLWGAGRAATLPALSSAFVACRCACGAGCAALGCTAAAAAAAQLALPSGCGAQHCAAAAAPQGMCASFAPVAIAVGGCCWGARASSGGMECED
jgi:hypothetical protein